ncbi:26S proteasome regulatory subunit RPN8 [Dictyocoela muelleri]|nr:26S proteasome regulatory subunit RPN8 [Dictyocoela muelleri]
MTEIHLHPIVLLSISDHYRRQKEKTVVGALMGTIDENIHIKNSFAVPYKKNTFLDTSYLQDMLDLQLKVNNEKFIGWYHTGRDLTDIEISSHQLERDPLLLSLKFEDIGDELPVKIFRLENGELVNLNFKISADEAEEVGVEHLIRGMRNTNVGLGQIKEIKGSMREYHKKIQQLLESLKNVEEKKLNITDKNLLNMCQNALNQIRSIDFDIEESEMIKYVSSLAKTVVLIDDLKRNSEIEK